MTDNVFGGTLNIAQLNPNINNVLAVEVNYMHVNKCVQDVLAWDIPPTWKFPVTQLTQDTE